MSESIIVFPEKLTVGIKGFKPFNTTDPELGFMTPNTGDSAYKKRLSTVENWCRGYRGQHGATPSFNEIDNQPITGFQILNSVSRWSNDNKVFRLKDPRGFVLEIATGNLEMILQTSNILKGGFIEDKCVWGRNGTNNILVPITADIYSKSVEFAEKKTNSLSDLVPGQLIKFNDGRTDTYLGKFTVVGTTLSDDDAYEFKIQEKVHAFKSSNSRSIKFLKKPNNFVIVGTENNFVDADYYRKEDGWNFSYVGNSYISNFFMIKDGFKLNELKVEIDYNLDNNSCFYHDKQSDSVYLISDKARYLSDDMSPHTRYSVSPDNTMYKQFSEYGVNVSTNSINKMYYGYNKVVAKLNLNKVIQIKGLKFIVKTDIETFETYEM
jgi:hypothetical protein